MPVAFGGTTDWVPIVELSPAAVSTWLTLIVPGGMAFLASSRFRFASKIEVLMTWGSLDSSSSEYHQHRSDMSTPLTTFVPFLDPPRPRPRPLPRPPPRPRPRPRPQVDWMEFIE